MVSNGIDVAKLIERIEDLEKRQELIISVLSQGLPEPLKWGNTALLFLLTGFTAKEISALEAIIGKAVKKQYKNKPINATELITELEHNLPKRNIKQIFEAYRRDELFEPICELILSKYY